MLRTTFILAALAAFAPQAASADHLVPDFYTAEGTVDFRIEDRLANDVRMSCEDKPLLGYLRVTGPDTAELLGREGTGGDCHPKGPWQ